MPDISHLVKLKGKTDWRLLIGNAIFLSCGLIGFAHIFLAAGIDYAIFKRFGKENSLFFSI
jgi:hypothetical protein